MPPALSQLYLESTSPRYKRTLLFGLAGILVISSGTGTARASLVPTSNPVRRLDLSFLHRTKSNLLTEAIRDFLLVGSKGEDVNDDDNVGVEIDVTASYIEKDIQDLISLLHSWKPPSLSGVTDNSQRPRNIALTASRNHLTAKDATLLFQKICSDTRQSTKTPKRGNKKMSSKLKDVKEVVASQSSNQDSGNKRESSTSEAISFLSITKLDLSQNYLGSNDNKINKGFLKAVEQMIGSSDKCPVELRLQVCGLGPSTCRAIGKGLVARFSSKWSKDGAAPPPMSLYLTRNEAIGDVGAAALGSAIRAIASKRDGLCMILDTLDLSGCGITDTGAIALAMALEQCPFCIQHLNLSNNHITNEGAAAIGRALAGTSDITSTGKIETLDLSHNKDIDNLGAQALAGALGKGAIENLILRSCHIHADGAEAIATSLRSLMISSKRPSFLQIDLSGNPLGILRKKGPSSKKYSATALRNKATATTTAYMNMLGKTVQRGLKEFGVYKRASPDLWDSDEEGDTVSLGNEEDQFKLTHLKCGGLAIADALLAESDGDGVPSATAPCKVVLGLRHCALETKASEALAAVCQRLQSSHRMEVSMDVRMNGVLEEETVAALRRDPTLESHLHDLAEQYLAGVEALRIARQKSFEAAKAAAARLQAEKVIEDAWGAAVPMGDEDEVENDFIAEQDDEWDSDAQYDDMFEESDY